MNSLEKIEHIIDFLFPSRKSSDNKMETTISSEHQTSNKIIWKLNQQGSFFDEIETLKRIDESKDAILLDEDVIRAYSTTTTTTFDKSQLSSLNNSIISSISTTNLPNAPNPFQEIPVPSIFSQIISVFDSPSKVTLTQQKPTIFNSHQSDISQFLHELIEEISLYSTSVDDLQHNNMNEFYFQYILSETNNLVQQPDFHCLQELMDCLIIWIGEQNISSKYQMNKISSSCFIRSIDLFSSLISQEQINIKQIALSLSLSLSWFYLTKHFSEHQIQRSNIFPLTCNQATSPFSSQFQPTIIIDKTTNIDPTILETCSHSTNILNQELSSLQETSANVHPPAKKAKLSHENSPITKDSKDNLINTIDLLSPTPPRDKSLQFDLNYNDYYTFEEYEYHTSHENSQYISSSPSFPSSSTPKVPITKEDVLASQQEPDWNNLDLNQLQEIAVQYGLRLESPSKLKHLLQSMRKHLSQSEISSFQPSQSTILPLKEESNTASSSSSLIIPSEASKKEKKPSKKQTSTSTINTETLEPKDILKNLIFDNDDFYQQVLIYDPLDVEKIQQTLKQTTSSNQSTKTTSTKLSKKAILQGLDQLNVFVCQSMNHNTKKIT